MNKHVKSEIDLETDLNRIHKVISRSIAVILNKCRLMLDKPELSPNHDNGFELYLECFLTVLDSHHRTEDELVFPLFKEKAYEIPFRLLESQHKEMDVIHQQIDRLIIKYKQDPSEKTTLKEMVDQFSKLQDLWKIHITEEEKHFTNDKIDQIFNRHQIAILSRRFAEYGRKHAHPSYLVLPFILYNLSNDERQIMESLMPALLIRVFMPFFWKKKWSPMKVYLTNPPG